MTVACDPLEKAEGPPPPHPQTHLIPPQHNVVCPDQFPQVCTVSANPDCLRLPIHLPLAARRTPHTRKR